LERSDLDGAREALMVIAHSAQSLDGDLGRRADEVAARAIPQGAGYPTTLIELEWLGLQARGGRQLNIDQAETLAAILDEDEDRGVPRVVFTESDRSAGASVAQLVAGITLSELVAYARFISRPHTGEVKMDARAVRFLEQSLADAFRFGVPARRMQEVASAAARVRLRAQPVTVDETLTRIRALARDAAARRGETEIAKAETLMLSSEARAQFIEGLRLAWQRESEPETKLALAELIIHGVIAVGNESQRAR
jgi:hypothetical protein